MKRDRIVSNPNCRLQIRWLDQNRNIIANASTKAGVVLKAVISSFRFPGIFPIEMTSMVITKAKVASTRGFQSGH